MSGPSPRLLSLLIAAAGAGAVFILGAGSPAVGSEGATKVRILDDCNPASFNAVLGPKACVGDGRTTFQAFVAEAIAKKSVAAWRFKPTAVTVHDDGHLLAQNRGGEGHTFSEVAKFGGGCVAQVNALVGLSPVRECATSEFGKTLVLPGHELATTALSPGVHRFECLIHPWMRTVVTVREDGGDRG